MSTKTKARKARVWKGWIVEYGSGVQSDGGLVPYVWETRADALRYQPGDARAVRVEIREVLPARRTR